MNTIQIIGIIIAFLVGIEHIGIAFLEIFGNSQLQAKSFDMNIKFLEQKPAKISMANQGIYNGLLGLLIILVWFIFPFNWLLVVWQLLLGFIVIAGIFGGFTATKKIFLVQMLPALIALICLSF